MNKYIVAHKSEIPIGSRKIVRVNNREIGIFNVNGQYYALKNACPHQEASLCKGEVTGTFLLSNVNEYEYGREGEIVKCPWHKWEFDIKTGQALFDSCLKVATYEITEEADNIVVFM